MDEFYFIFLNYTVSTENDEIKFYRHVSDRFLNHVKLLSIAWALKKKADQIRIVGLTVLTGGDLNLSAEVSSLIEQCCS